MAMVHAMEDAMATAMVCAMRVMVTAHAMMHLLTYSTCTLYTIILLNAICFFNQLLIA